jgi:tetratricopeptide (TPR) repeat protein
MNGKKREKIIYQGNFFKHGILSYCLQRLSMVTPSEGLIKVFVSSTFRDLEDERTQILKKLNQAVLPIGMEYFIPEGITSQEIALFHEKDGIINADHVIFLISPRYGSLIEECKLKDRCKANCPMKTGTSKPISYTHCEYKFAKAENKNCQIYLYDKNGWELVKILQNMKKLDLPTIRANPIYYDYSTETLEQFFSVRDNSILFKNEIQGEFAPILDSPQLSKITQNLAKVIERWYSEGKIDFKNFYGRRKTLSNLIEKLDSSVEVYGVGGIGKTALIQIALLLQKLKGKQILSIGKKQTYLSGSGYWYFKEKCNEDIFEITTNLITINDVLEALKLNAALKIENVDEKISIINTKINDDNLLIFIDDFHLADNHVKKLVAVSKGIIIASKSNSGITQKQIQLTGIEDDERHKLIDLISANFDKKIPHESKEQIKKISEGHPITIELLVRNFDKLDLKKYEDLKSDVLVQSNPQQVEEFIKRVIIDILSPDAFQLIKILSIINTEVENDIHKETLIKTVRFHDNLSSFVELIHTGLIKKKENNESAYQFSFKHIQEAIRENDKNLHHTVINYYKNKLNWVGKRADDEVELLQHSMISDPNSDFTKSFLAISSHIEPIDYNFKRLIGIGEQIKASATPENQSLILLHLGNKYMIMHRYKEAKKSYISYLTLTEQIFSKNKGRYLNAKRPVLINLGNLYYNINKYKESESSYLQALDICEELFKKYPNIDNKIELAKILQNLGNVQKHLDNFLDAEKSYDRSLILKYEIAKKQKNFYSYEVAAGLNNLAGLYYQLGRYPDAEKKSRESIDIISKLKERNPSKYEPIYYQYVANLGRICLPLENFPEAEAKLLESYGKLENYFKINPDAFCPDIVATLDALVRLYLESARFKEADDFAKKSEKIKEYLVKQCSYAYLSSQASTYANLGYISSTLNKPDEALEYVRKSENILDKLSEKSPNYYLTDLLYLNNVRGRIFLKLHNYSETKKAWCRSLEISRELVKREENAYLPYLTIVLNNLGYFYLTQKQYDLSKKYLTECLIYRRKLVYQCRDAHLGDLTHTLNTLGNLYTEQAIKLEPEQYFIESQNICEMLISSKKEIYQVNYAETLHNFGNYYISIKRYKDAKKNLNIAYNIRKNLSSKDIDLYLEDFVETLQKIGEVFILEKEYDDAEECLIKSKDHCLYLISKNSEIFNPLYATSLNLLGKVLLLKPKSKLADAESYLQKAVFIRRMYFENYPQVFGQSLLESLRELRTVFIQKNNEVNHIDKEIEELKNKMDLIKNTLGDCVESPNIPDSL